MLDVVVRFEVSLVESYCLYFLFKAFTISHWSNYCHIPRTPLKLSENLIPDRGVVLTG